MHPNFEACLCMLRQTPGILRNLLSLATREQLDWRPSSERWSIAMVLAHLADVEAKRVPQPFRAMLARGPATAARLRSSGRCSDCRTEFDPYAEMARFEEERSQTLTLLEGMPESAGERAGPSMRNSGSITIAQLLNEFAFHDLGHIRQVDGIVPGARVLSGDGRVSGVLQDQPLSGAEAPRGLEARPPSDAILRLWRLPRNGRTCK